jgi:hypothetical protein
MNSHFQSSSTTRASARKAVQIHLVLVKHLKELANESQQVLSSEERAELEKLRDAEIEAEVAER